MYFPSLLGSDPALGRADTYNLLLPNTYNRLLYIII